MELRKGYTAMTQFIYGDDLVWKSYGEDNVAWPSIYETELEVQKELVEEPIRHINEFLSGDRDYDKIMWEPDGYLVSIEIDENDHITCWTEDGHEVYSKSLTEWRAGL